MAKISKPILYALVLGTAALVFVIATEPEPVATKGRTKRTVNTTTTRKTEAYLPEDYKAKFAVLNETPKDAFRPLVARRKASVQATPPDPDIIPFEATGGEPSWYYTGVVEVNGSKMALVENESTGEGVYLREGERWKKVVVSSISDEALLLKGPSGTPFRIKLGERENPPPSEEVPAGVAPVQPPLQGVIGSGAAVVPPLPGISTNELAVQPEETVSGRRPRRRQRQ